MNSRSSSMSTDGKSLSEQLSKREPVHLKGSEGLVSMNSRSSSIRVAVKSSSV